MTNPILRPSQTTDDYTLAIIAASTARYMCALRDVMVRMERDAEECGETLPYDFEYACRMLTLAVTEVDEVLAHAKRCMEESEGLPW